MDSIWTKDELLSLIDDWKAAYRAASSGKAYSIGSRSLTRQNLPEILDQLRYLQRELQALTRGQSGPITRRALVVR